MGGGLRGITAEDISVKTKVCSTVEITTYCDVCGQMRERCLLLQNWVHGSLYVCPECRQQACVETEGERLERRRVGAERAAAQKAQQAAQTAQETTDDDDEGEP